MAPLRSNWEAEVKLASTLSGAHCVPGSSHALEQLSRPPHPFHSHNYSFFRINDIIYHSHIFHFPVHNLYVNNPKHHRKKKEKKELGPKNNRKCPVPVVQNTFLKIVRPDEEEESWRERWKKVIYEGTTNCPSVVSQRILWLPEQERGLTRQSTRLRHGCNTESWWEQWQPDGQVSGANRDLTKTSLKERKGDS